MTEDKSPNNLVQDEQETTVSEEKQSNTEKEIGGPKGPEPTRYGDWEKNGRCIDF